MGASESRSDCCNHLSAPQEISDDSSDTYDEEDDLSQYFDNTEKITSIEKIVVPMNGRGLALAGQITVAIIPILGQVAGYMGLLTPVEHHGLLFKTEKNDYYYSQFGGKKYPDLVKCKRDEGIEDIVLNCDFQDKKKYWVKKIKVKKCITLGELSKIIDSLRDIYAPDNYSKLKNNCQNYVKRLLTELWLKKKIIYKD